MNIEQCWTGEEMAGQGEYSSNQNSMCKVPKVKKYDSLRECCTVRREEWGEIQMERKVKPEL